MAEVPEPPKNANMMSMYGSLIRFSTSLFLFLTTYWYFFSFGPTDMAMAAPLGDFFALFYVIPFLGLIVYIPLMPKIIASKRVYLQLILRIISFGMLLSYLIIVVTNPIFGSGWTWAFHDMRELNYLAPWLKVTCYMAQFCTLLLEYDSLSRGPLFHSDPRAKSFILGGSCLAFAGFGAIQYYLSAQPSWISISVLTWITVIEGFISFWFLWKSSKVENGIRTENLSETPKTTGGMDKIGKFLIFLGLLLVCVWSWLFPAQLAFQEGPANPWGLSVIIGAATGIILIVIWEKTKSTMVSKLEMVMLIGIISPLLLSAGWFIIPNMVLTAQSFSLCMAIGVFLWILYMGTTNPRLQRFSLILLWIWGLSYLIFIHDPLFEVWEMEEGLLKAKIGGPDLYGTGIGSYYPVALLIGMIFVLIVGGICLIQILRIKVPKQTDDNSNQPFVPEIQPNNKNPHGTEMEIKIPKKQITASFIILIIMISSTTIFTSYAVSARAPTVVAEMGNHGALWLANSYDRVAPDYHPDFAFSPRNSTIDVYAMKGESELVQLVFSPLASKMVSFQYYQWGNNVTAIGNNLWKDANGNLANISITMGRVGYISCISPSLADVILPWQAFITGNRQNVPFWLEVTVPRSITAGQYTTEFQIVATSYLQRIARNTNLQFTLRLTVWDITKPLNRTIDTVIGLWGENPKTQDALYKLGMKYGVDPYGVGNPEVIYNASDLSKGIYINWTPWDARVQEMLDAGMNQIKLDFYPGIDCRNKPDYVLNGSMDNYLTLIMWFYGNASVHLRSKLTPWGTTWESETITQHSDEPDWRIAAHTIEAFDKLYTMLDTVTSIRSLQTFMYEPEYDPWLDSLDIFVFTPDSYTEEIAQKIFAAGKEIWTYSNGDNFPGTDSDLRTPLIMTRLRGWVDFHYNITGFLHWVFYWNYNDAGDSGCGYDGRGDGTEIVPFYGGYLPTLRLVAFRDGLEDNELLWLMHKTVQVAIAKGISSPVLTEAIAILQRINTALSKQSVDQQWELPVITREFDHNAQNYMQLRIECGIVLSQLIPIVNA